MDADNQYKCSIWGFWQYIWKEISSKPDEGADYVDSYVDQCLCIVVSDSVFLGWVELYSPHLSTLH